MTDGREADTERSVPLVGPVIDLAQEALVNLGDLLPRLVDRSRRQADFALAVIERFRCGSVRETRDGITGEDEAGDGSEDTPAHVGGRGSSSAVSNGSTTRRPVLTALPIPRPSSDVGATTTPAPAVSTLSIPDYDSLAASQVLPRLDGLTPDELVAIRDYETAHRHRRTILGRLAQLLA